MRIVMSGLAAVIALSLAQPTLAQSPTEPAKKNAGDKIICKTDRSTGSHIARRTCKKRSQWEYERSQAQDDLQDRRMNTDPKKLEGIGG